MLNKFRQCAPVSMKRQFDKCALQAVPVPAEALGPAGGRRPSDHRCWCMHFAWGSPTASPRCARPCRKSGQVCRPGGLTTTSTASISHPNISPFEFARGPPRLRPRWSKPCAECSTATTDQQPTADGGKGHVPDAQPHLRDEEAHKYGMSSNMLAKNKYRPIDHSDLQARWRARQFYGTDLLRRTVRVIAQVLVSEVLQKADQIISTTTQWGPRWSCARHLRCLEGTAGESTAMWHAASRATLTS